MPLPVKQWLLDIDLIEDDEIDLLAYLHHQKKVKRPAREQHIRHQLLELP
jgi:hypothetical protein